MCIVALLQEPSQHLRTHNLFMNNIKRTINSHNCGSDTFHTCNEWKTNIWSERGTNEPTFTGKCQTTFNKKNK